MEADQNQKNKQKTVEFNGTDEPGLLGCEFSEDQKQRHCEYREVRKHITDLVLGYALYYGLCFLFMFPLDLVIWGCESGRACFLHDLIFNMPPWNFIIT